MNVTLPNAVSEILVYQNNEMVRLLDDFLIISLSKEEKEYAK